MRALAMTGMVTASWMPLIMLGSLMRATPPSRRMSAGTRSSAITAAAPASSAIFACSGVTTSMITPPLSISARPALTRNVASSRISPIVRGGSAPPRLTPRAPSRRRGQRGGPPLQPGGARHQRKPVALVEAQRDRVLEADVELDRLGPPFPQPAQGAAQQHLAEA